MSTETTPHQRIAAYLRQFDRFVGTGGVIHVAHSDPNAEPATLTSADLRSLLAEVGR